MAKSYAETRLPSEWQEFEPDYAADTTNTIDEVTKTKSKFLSKCDSTIQTEGRSQEIVKGEQLVCYEVKKKLAAGGQAETFTGKKDPKKVTNDTLYQEVTFLTAHQLAEETGEPLSNFEYLLSKAEDITKELFEEKGKRGLRKARKDLLERNKKEKPGLHTPGNDVCIRVTKEILTAAQASRLERLLITMGLRHPNIVYLYNFGKIKDRGVFISELIKGVVEPFGFSLDQLVDGAVDAATGLKFMHDNGLIHRDVKPENIMFKRPNGGRVKAKLIDFGLMKVQDYDTPGQTLTKSLEAGGTVIYCSPEQAFKLKNADAQSDVYSFGATLYDILTWECPNPVAPESRSSPQVYLANLVEKYFGRPGTRPIRIMSVDRRVTLREMFGLALEGKEKNKDEKKKYIEIKSQDINAGKVNLCSKFKELYYRFRHHRKYKDMVERLEHLECIIAVAMHPGEREDTDENGNIMYTRKFRYENMDQVIKDLEAVRNGEQPTEAFGIIENKFGNSKRRTRDKFIQTVFDERNRFAKRTISDRIYDTASYGTKAIGATLLGAGVGGIIGTLLDRYTNVYETVANFINNVLF
jgi:serine/threonine protein kinase